MLYFTEEDHKKSAKWFMPALVIGFLLVTVMLLSGCAGVESVVTGAIRVTANTLKAIATN